MTWLRRRYFVMCLLGIWPPSPPYHHHSKPYPPPPPTPKPSLIENVSLIRHELLYVLHAKLLNNNDQESMTVVILTDVSL